MTTIDLYDLEDVYKHVAERLDTLSLCSDDSDWVKSMYKEFLQDVKGGKINSNLKSWNHQVSECIRHMPDGGKPLKLILQDLTDIYKQMEVAVKNADAIKAARAAAGMPSVEKREAKKKADKAIAIADELKAKADELKVKAAQAANAAAQARIIADVAVMSL